MLKKIKLYCQKTSSKIVGLILLILLVGVSTSIFEKKEESKADYPKSLECKFYSYTADVFPKKEYTIEFLIYPHPDRLKTESVINIYYEKKLVDTSPFFKN